MRALGSDSRRFSGDKVGGLGASSTTTEATITGDQRHDTLLAERTPINPKTAVFRTRLDFPQKGNAGCIHAGQMHRLIHHLGEDGCFQFGGGTIGHPMGIQAKATEYRILLETVIQARDEGNDLLAEGPEILERAVKVALPALAGARDFEAGEALTPYVAAISKR